MSFHARDGHRYINDMWQPQQRDIQNIRIKLAKAEIREISFHGTLHRVLGNCWLNAFQIKTHFPNCKHK